MEFEHIDEMESQYKKNRICKCENCGYAWEMFIDKNNELSELEEEPQDFCPMCGGSYLDQM